MLNRLIQSSAIPADAAENAVQPALVDKIRAVTLGDLEFGRALHAAKPEHVRDAGHLLAYAVRCASRADWYVNLWDADEARPDCYVFTVHGVRRSGGAGSVFGIERRDVPDWIDRILIPATAVESPWFDEMVRGLVIVELATTLGANVGVEPSLVYATALAEGCAPEWNAAVTAIAREVATLARQLFRDRVRPDEETAVEDPCPWPTEFILPEDGLFTRSANFCG